MTRHGKVVVLMASAAVVLAGGIAAVAANDDDSDYQARQEAASPIFDDQTNEESKQEIQEENDALASIGDAHPDTGEHSSPPAVDTSDEPWGHGVSDGGSEYPPNTGFSFNEAIWQGDSNGSHIRMYAGAYSEKPETGVVLVQFVDPDTWDHTFEQYEVSGSGSLTIESADGNVVTLAEADGGEVRFDVDALSFTD